MGFFGSTPTAGQLPGAATNDNANAGNVGEHLSSLIPLGSAVALAAGVPANVTSITLTPGDWDVAADAIFSPAATTNYTFLIASLSIISAAMDTTPGAFGQISEAAAGKVTGGNLQTIAIPPTRFSVASNTTIYLVVNTGFSVSTLSAYGTLRARRVR